METFKIGVQVIHSYSLDIIAKDENEACDKVRDMGSLAIADIGHLEFVDVDYIEVIQ